MSPVFLQKAIAICEKIEKGEIDLNVIPYNDPSTDYLISKINDCSLDKWNDCTLNSASDWWAFRPSNSPLNILYLKNKHSGNVYFLTD